MAELRAATPDSLKTLVTDLFETVTLWEVKADSATVTRTVDGRWDVALAIQARKLRADSIGRETEIPMNDLVEIGVFGDAGEGSLGKPIHLERHRIRDGKQSREERYAASPNYELQVTAFEGELQGRRSALPDGDECIHVVATTEAALASVMERRTVAPAA